MKRSDATVLAVVLVVGLIAVFWFAVLAPKRSEVSSLDSQTSDLQSQLQSQQQTIATAQQAQANFGPSYHKLVVLGKAVPADSDQASLLVQLNTLANRAGVSFRSLTLSGDAGAAAATTPTAPTTDTSTSTNTTSTTSSTDTTSTTDTTSATGTPTASTTGVPPVAPTEVAASLLPLGASIGPAGLPVMPYDLTFTGGYFEISKFLHEVDSLVHSHTDQITVSGRLVTVNSFDLAPPSDASTTSSTPKASSQQLEAKLSVMTYVTPADQGLTAGATPTAPAPTTATAVPTATPTAAATTP